MLLVHPAVQPRGDRVTAPRGLVRGVAWNDYESVLLSLHPSPRRVATRLTASRFAL